MQYFFDTSAVVKLYHQEAGSELVLPLYTAEQNIVVSELSKVEFLSTVHKKYRTNEISLAALEALKNRFMVDAHERFTVIPIVSPVIDKALEIIESYAGETHLFALDSIQVATYLVASDNDTIFVCADKRLTAFVKKLGYGTLDA